MSVKPNPKRKTLNAIINSLSKKESRDKDYVPEDDEIEESEQLSMMDISAYAHSKNMNLKWNSQERSYEHN